MVESIRCPGCGGRGRVPSTKEAVRSAFGKLTESDVGDPKVFDQVKGAYLALNRRPRVDPPKNESAPAVPAGTRIEHGIAGTDHLGPRRWRARCKCGFGSSERGTETAATNEVLRHVEHQ